MPEPPEDRQGPEREAKEDKGNQFHCQYLAKKGIRQPKRNPISPKKPDDSCESQPIIGFDNVEGHDYAAETPGMAFFQDGPKTMDYFQALEALPGTILGVGVGEANETLQQREETAHIKLVQHFKQANRTKLAYASDRRILRNEENLLHLPAVHMSSAFVGRGALQLLSLNASQR